ncbi:MAG: TrkH family potassium uptake protein, partial [Saprospiraceae bacterium]|nr:TrkH family potassium uptake protein [Saprospiraceae bacterium]
MLSCLPACYYYQGGDEGPLAFSALICFVFGIPLFLLKSEHRKGVNKREGYLIVTIGWIMMSLFGMLPFIFSGVLPGAADAFFETASGLTTTGATVISDIEGTPKGILLWRSLTHWIGGMGIIVLTVALFPLLGIGGVELFVAEAPGPTTDKVHPRIRETAKRLWLIYVALTGLLTLLLWLEGMTFFDAINHSMATMATGGFSTKNASIAYYTSPLIQYTLILFMFIAGVNYTIIYYGLKGKFKKVWGSDEFRAYLILVLVLAVFITAGIHHSTDQPL